MQDSDMSMAANHFTFTGGDGTTTITYDTSGIDGRPHFQYHTGDGDLSFTGDDIRTADHEIGTLVTVTIKRTVDTGFTSLTLLVPQFNLNDNSCTFTTYAVTTTHHLFAGAPRLVKGPLQTYEVLDLQGSAEAVDF